MVADFITVCARCRKRVRQPATGHRRRYCSNACRQAHYRHRLANGLDYGLGPCVVRLPLSTSDR